MRVYIISTQENIPFAEELLEDVPNVRVISHSIEEGIIANLDEPTMNKIKDSDVVLAIVDKKFIGNTMLYMELEFALIWGKKTRKPILLPIILDDAIVSDGELREKQTANYFSDIYPIDCAVLSANAQSYPKCCTLLAVLLSA